MVIKIVDLYKEFHFPRPEGAEGWLTCYIARSPSSMEPARRRGGVLILPGGGYAYTSEREGEPVALRYLGKGLQAFVLSYSCAPAVFPTALREAALAGSWALLRRKSRRWDFPPAGICAAASAPCLTVRRWRTLPRRRRSVPMFWASITQWASAGAGLTVAASGIFPGEIRCWPPGCHWRSGCGRICPRPSSGTPGRMPPFHAAAPCCWRRPWRRRAFPLPCTCTTVGLTGCLWGTKRCTGPAAFRKSARMFRLGWMRKWHFLRNAG